MVLENSDDKSKDCEIMEIIIPALKRQKPHRRKRRVSKPHLITSQKSSPTTPIRDCDLKTPNGEFFTVLKNFELKFSTEDGGRESLHFNNPSDEDLATR